MLLDGLDLVLGLTVLVDRLVDGGRVEGVLGVEGVVRVGQVVRLDLDRLDGAARRGRVDRLGGDRAVVEIIGSRVSGTVAVRDGVGEGDGRHCGGYEV